MTEALPSTTKQKPKQKRRKVSNVHRMYIADIFSRDCKKLIKLCTEDEEKLTYRKFVKIWRDMNFSSMYEGWRPQELLELASEVIRVAKEYMVDSSKDFEVNVAGVFLCYVLMTLQPVPAFLRMAPRDMAAIRRIEAQARKERRLDLLCILGKVLIKGPMQYYVKEIAGLGAPNTYLNDNGAITRDRNLYDTRNSNTDEIDHMELALWSELYGPNSDDEDDPVVCVSESLEKVKDIVSRAITEITTGIIPIRRPTSPVASLVASLIAPAPAPPDPAVPGCSTDPVEPALPKEPEVLSVRRVLRNRHSFRFRVIRDPWEPPTTILNKQKLVDAIEAGADQDLSMTKVLKASGTLEDPTLVRSSFDACIVGCVCGDNAQDATWLWVHKVLPRQCECGHWYKMVPTQQQENNSSVQCP